MKYSSKYAVALSRLYKDAMRPKESNAIKGIALFSGCGGMTLGFEAAGVDLVGHVEIAESANRIYAENFPKSKLLGEDICEISDEDLQAWRNEFGDIDIIVGGPPCQGFSLAGKRNPEDERNKLYQQYVRIVSAIRPKVFVMENVALMTSMKDESGELFIDKIEKSFSKQGYSLVKRIVNAYEYGVPQSRERVILIGVRKDINKTFVFEIPPYSLDEPTHQMELWGEKKKALTFRDATGDLQSVENGEKSYADPLHWAITHPEHVIEWLKDVPEGHSVHENKNPELRPPSGFNTTYKRNNKTNIQGGIAMALDPRSEGHLFQIEAGTEGRLQGHKFEQVVTEELNNIDFMSGNTFIECVKPNVYHGNPANALVSHISQDKGKQINRLNAYWLGGLATAGAGANILNENGEKITGSKLDILMDVEYEDGTNERIGVSAKACSNNAQMALTTVSVFCGMLRENGIDVSEDAEIGLRMFCGEVGYRPIDGYTPKDMSNVPQDRKARLAS